jgi:hypothetical protein
MRHLATVVFVVLLAVGSLSAATFESIPTDRQLLDRADLVVVARVMEVTSREIVEGVIVTESILAIEQLVKGDHPDPTLVVSQYGGFANGRGIVIAGSAEYSAGSRVLTFLRQRDDGTHFTAYMGLGKYRFDRAADGREIVLRDLDGIEADEGEVFDARLAEAFIDSLRNGAAERDSAGSRLRVGSLSASDINPRAESVGSYSLTGPGGIPLRWANGGNAVFVLSGSQGTLGAATSQSSVDDALAAWKNAPFASISISRSPTPGTKTSTSPIEDISLDPANYETNDIVLGHSGSGMPSYCDQGIGCGIAYVSGPNHFHRGVEFYSIKYGDVVILQSATSNATHLAALVAHELGHALGFRHSNAGTPSSSNALMNSQPPLNQGAVLRDWDQEAAAEVYGSGFPCDPVAVTGTSGGGSVPYGATRALGVTLTGKSPFTYQWYEGTSPDTSIPLAGQTFSTFGTDPITETKSYWVQVKNCSGQNTANSPTITVVPQECAEPVITTQPQSKRIEPGTSTTLTVAVSGTTPLTYEWYEGATGNTSKRVGTNFSFTTPVLHTQTSYWVRVKNCNGFGQVDSDTAVITIGTQCVGATIAVQPANKHIAIGQAATFTVTPAGDAPFTYQWYAGEAGDDSNPIAGATSASYTTPELTEVGDTKYWVRVSNQCGHANSNTVTVTVLCPDHIPLNVFTPAITHFSVAYGITWDGEVEISPLFELQEATDQHFTQDLKTFTIAGETSFAIDAKGPLEQDTRFFYRVRGISSCAGASEYSPAASTVVTKSLPAASSQFSISAPDGSHLIPQSMFIPGFGEEAAPGDGFSVTVDVPWLMVSPSSGNLPAAGLTVQLTASTATLDTGTTSATILVNRISGSAARIGTHATSTTTTIPFSMSLVTPVSPIPRDTTPPPGTLIIPAVGHAQGIGTFFQSDIRLVNASNQPIEYQLSWTPSGHTGTQVGKKSTVVIQPNDGKSIDDIVKAWYGAGVLGEPGVGTIEIRPLNNSDPFTTYASSRSYAISSAGTLGQFVPAIPLTQFIGNIAQNPGSLISLQQIANSAAYRTNVGFVEGSGQTVQLLVKLLDGNNNVLQQALRTLPPYGHEQIGMASLFPNITLNDGRLEVHVVSPGGKATAYASVVDNKSSDPLMVFPAQPATISSGRYVVPGIADLVGISRFASDMRVYNGGQFTEQLTLNYYPQAGDPTPRPEPINRTIAPGQILAIDNVLPSLWSLGQTGGAVSIDASPESSLVVTARTYSPLPDGGTNGQFIAGFTADDAVGVGEHALQVLQLEQSPQYRTNFGLVEVTGKDALVELIAYKPDSKISAITHVPMAANEFRQIGFILRQFFGDTNIYGARISARVIGGEGRVASFASVVDSKTSDPTYVPPQ